MAHTFANALALVAGKERHISFEEEGIKTHTQKQRNNKLLSNFKRKQNKLTCFLFTVFFFCFHLKIY